MILQNSLQPPSLLPFESVEVRYLVNSLEELGCEVLESAGLPGGGC